ncbi:hypothetical protein IWZ00DRAFT_185350 [Phyllosticta capitalensis]
MRAPPKTNAEDSGRQLFGGGVVWKFVSFTTTRMPSMLHRRPSDVFSSDTNFCPWRACPRHHVVRHTPLAAKKFVSRDVQYLQHPSWLLLHLNMVSRSSRLADWRQFSAPSHPRLKKRLRSGQAPYSTYVTLGHLDPQPALYNNSPRLSSVTIGRTILHVSARPHGAGVSAPLSGRAAISHTSAVDGDFLPVPADFWPFCAQRRALRSPLRPAGHWNQACPGSGEAEGVATGVECWRWRPAGQGRRATSCVTCGAAAAAAAALRSLPAAWLKIMSSLVRRAPFSSENRLASETMLAALGGVPAHVGIRLSFLSSFLLFAPRPRMPWSVLNVTPPTVIRMALAL